MDKGKPGLAILIGHALAKKGKAQHDPMPEADDEDVEPDYSEHLKEIASDLIDAIHAKDVDATAELLEEAFECLEAEPHKEGPHLGEDESY